MNATPATTPEQSPLLGEMQEPIHLVIPGPLPSWNDVLGMDHWARDRLKKGIQERFLSALQRSACDFSTKTTCARNTMSIAADTLASFQATQRAKRALRRAKKKLEANQNSGLKS